MKHARWPVEGVTGLGLKPVMICGAVQAVCGLGLMVIRLVTWTGSPLDVLTLIFSVVMAVAGGILAVSSMVYRQRTKKRQQGI